MTRAGSNGDELQLAGINPFLRQVLAKPHGEPWMSTKAINAKDCAEGKPLLLHTASQSPLSRRGQGPEVLLRDINLEEVNDDDVTLNMAPLHARSESARHVSDATGK